MPRTFLAVMSAFTVAVLLCSCGPDNVGACKDHVRTINALSCIGDNAKDETNCENATVYGCDVSDYYECLTSHYVCDGDMLDVAEHDKASSCVDFLVCDPSWF